MTQEDKELLLKDLCARLPYKVVVDYGYNAFDVHNGNYVKQGSKCILNCYLLDVFISPRQNEKGEYIKPYLRPMSSMTEEEISDLQKINCQFIFNKFDNFAYVGAADDGFCSVEEMDNILDYLDSKHFDYRGLIGKGLALEAPEDILNERNNNNINENNL